MKALDPWGPICLNWRVVRAVNLMFIDPKVRDMLDALAGLIPFDTTNLLLEASDSDTLAFAAFAGYLDDAERAGLIDLAEEMKIQHYIGKALVHLAD